MEAGATTTTPGGGLYTAVRRMAPNLAGPEEATPRTRALALLPAALTVVAFAVLFAQPIYLLVRDWWTLPEAGHGLLLAPVAIWLAWKSGIRPDAKGNVALGIAMLVFAVLIRFAAGLAAELFTMRASMVLALGGLTVYHYGFRQLLRWWLPFLLACLSIPLPELITQALALPLQFKASQMGAALLAMAGDPGAPHRQRDPAAGPRAVRDRSVQRAAVADGAARARRADGRADVQASRSRACCSCCWRSRSPSSSTACACS